MTTAERVADFARDHLEDTISELTNYLRVPAISCDAAHHADVATLAGRISSDLSALGFESQVRSLDGALPLVAAERRCSRADAPTLLVYGHFDLQPVRGEAWSSPPHEARREKTSDGERLFARGAADDMGGWVSHLAAIRAWLEVAGDLPLHLRLLLEGEEEIGSPNLERYMDAFPGDFAADFMVLTDCENPSIDLPGLTTSLRGLYEVELVCEALTSDVHSGLWGNMAPDVGWALVSALGRLVDEHGRPRFGAMEVPEAFRQGARSIPLDAEVIREGAHLLPGVEPLPEVGRPAAEWLWRQPAITILSTTLPRPDGHKNALRASASANLSIRIPPGRTKEQLRNELEALVLRDAPLGVRVRLVERAGGAESWLYEPRGPAFEAADRAYAKAWGRPLVQIGIGGSIPFVALFGRRYAHLPLILNGVMDPKTGAHGPDESLHLGVFEKAILANVHLYDELASCPTSG
ncbi:MAG TPA: M20/M25/M40 family metallo-hydrolase [Polyangiaceae bacterium]|nr:M20/M25/M40 family metallo-hydrolase [Polyangiaceae bacterium]